MTQQEYYTDIIDRLDTSLEEIKIIAVPTSLVLSHFMVYIESKKYSEKTFQQHFENVKFIAHFYAHYDYRNDFFLHHFQGGPHNEYRYSTKVSEAKEKIKNYRITWRKLNKFIEQNFDFLDTELLKLRG